MDGVSPSYSQWQRSCCCDGRSVGKLGPGRVCGVNDFSAARGLELRASAGPGLRGEGESAFMVIYEAKVACTCVTLGWFRKERAKRTWATDGGRM